MRSWTQIIFLLMLIQFVILNAQEIDYEEEGIEIFLIDSYINNLNYPNSL